MADASERIKEHRDRKEKLEVAAEEARKLLSDRRQFLDSADTIATFAEDMNEFLKTSELTQTRRSSTPSSRRSRSSPGKAAIVYSIPTPEDSPIGGADAAEIALNGRVRSSVRHGGPKGTVDSTTRWRTGISIPGSLGTTASPSSRPPFPPVESCRTTRRPCRSRSPACGGGVTRTTVPRSCPSGHFCWPLREDAYLAINTT